MTSSNLFLKSTLIALLFQFNVFTPQLTSQNVLKGPYLIEPGESNMVIRWEMNEKLYLMVEYGLDTTETKKLKLNIRDSKHEAHLFEANLTKLKSNSIYYYRLITDNGSKWNSFKTYTSDQDQFTFVAMGDSRTNPDIFEKIMHGTYDVNPNFMISMGDIVEYGGAYEEWNNYFFSIVKDVIESTPIVSTLGDHEGDGDDGELFRYFLREKQTVDKQWFSFDYGIAHFISLDYRHPENQEMIDWFVNDITSSKKKWNFVYMHRPSYNLGGHRSAWGRDVWPDLFRKHQIDIVFAGHSHQYERFYPVRPKNESDAFPVSYITTGGAGAGLYEVVKSESVLAVSESVNHFVEVNISGDTLDLQAIRMDGSILDKFKIVKNNRGYNKEYENMIIPQERLNTISMFNSSISKSISAIPLYSKPVKYKLHLQGYKNEVIPFEIQLESTSANNYYMEAVVDTLKENEKNEVILEIFSRKEMRFSTWGELTPELRLRLIYEYNSKRDTLIGGAINYWPQ